MKSGLLCGVVSYDTWWASRDGTLGQMRVQPTLLNKCWWCPLKGYQALPNSVNWLRRVSRVEIEAVFSKAVQEIAWRDLQDDRVWRQGWVWWVGEVSWETTLQHHLIDFCIDNLIWIREWSGVIGRSEKAHTNTSLRNGSYIAWKPELIAAIK